MTAWRLWRAPERSSSQHRKRAAGTATTAKHRRRPPSGSTGRCSASSPRPAGNSRKISYAREERLVLGIFDSRGIALVVEHVAGARPGTDLSDEIARAVEPADLRIALHRLRGADASIERLSALVASRGRSRAADHYPRLEDMAGYGPALEWGLAVAADLAAYARGDLPWSACERSALLAAAPGSGKTLFAGLLARRAGVPLVAGSLAQWQSAGEGHLGTTLKSMRVFFEDAGKAAPCVALIDELDAFGDRRTFAYQHRDYSSQVVNGLLECLDGSCTRPSVLLIGASNLPDRIDPAILRSGRFDRRIDIPLPSSLDLAAILRHHLGSDLATEDLGHAARLAMGGTGADCAAWVRRARGRARRAGRDIAIGDLLLEIGQPAGERSDAADRRIALHEAGHAVVAHCLSHEIHELSIPGPAARMTAYANIDLLDAGGTRVEFEDMLTMLFGGRAAETIVLGQPSAGAAGDLAVATKLATRMHVCWGLGSGLASTETPAGASWPKIPSPIEAELRAGYDRACAFLMRHRGRLEQLADALLVRRHLGMNEIASILADAGDLASDRVDRKRADRNSPRRGQ